LFVFTWPIIKKMGDPQRPTTLLPRSFTFLDKLISSPETRRFCVCVCVCIIFNLIV
jgi:hypothetical protein